MRTVAIIQARMGSTRLPGKSAMLLQGTPLVQHVVDRVKQAGFDQFSIDVAIPKEPNSRVLKNAILGAGISQPDCSVNDLVGRYAATARRMDADIVVRIPADNPCVDPIEINRLMAAYEEDPPKWNVLMSNLDRDIHANGYPGGLGAEIYDARFIHWMDRNLTLPRHREHPHLWAFENQRVQTIQAPREIARPWLRFDVNTQADFDYIAKIYDALYPANPQFRTKDILKFLGET